ncbi:MAG: uracil-DNA glycosylase [Gammaproteobacteria bacterium]
MDSRQHAYLRAMGISVWQPRQPMAEAATGASESHRALASEHAAMASDVSALDWSALEASVQACQRCDLHRTRTQTVFGVGDRQAALMIIGEAPGVDEDRQGEPFVGRAGQLLNAMLQAIGLQRAQVYIANILKCHPPGNRDPSAAEAASCQDYLFRQIELVQPQLILVLGRIAAHTLLQTDAPLGTLRGQLHDPARSGVPMLVTYHPAYLLRTPKEKRKAWLDLLRVKHLLQAEAGA